MPNLTLPGYKYLGPGNDLFSGEPVNDADKVAQTHDWDYAQAKSKQDIFKADKSAIDSFKNTSGFGGFIGKTGLQIKNFFEESINHTVYPFNLPDKSMVGPPSKIRKLNPTEITKNKADSTTTDEPAAKKQKLQTNAFGADTTQSSMDPDNNMFSDAAGGSGVPAQTRGGGSLGSGQTATIFHGSAQHENWVNFNYQKTCRWAMSNKPIQHSYSIYEKERRLTLGHGICLPVQSLAWYLSYEEYAFLKKNFQEVWIEHATCDVHSYGVRLPFETNTTNSSVANASAQYPLCQWVGLENHYKIGMTNYNDTVKKVLGDDEWIKPKSDTNEDWSESFKNLSARITTRDIQSMAYIALPTHVEGGEHLQPNLNEFAQVINGTMNLDKVFSWSHKCKRGLMSQLHANHKAASTVEDSIALELNAYAPVTAIIAGDVASLASNSKQVDSLIKKRTLFKGEDYFLNTPIDGQMYINPRNMGFSTCGIKPFIVGLQNLRNSNDKILEAVWEFATVSTISIKAKKGVTGIYTYVSPMEYNGMNPYLHWGENGEYDLDLEQSNTYGKPAIKKRREATLSDITAEHKAAKERVSFDKTVSSLNHNYITTGNITTI